MGQHRPLRDPENLEGRFVLLSEQVGARSISSPPPDKFAQPAVSHCAWERGANRTPIRGVVFIHKW